MVDARRREEEALAWVRRLHDPAFSDWQAHFAWLEADPGNPAAFDRLLLLVDEATAGLAPAAAADLSPANDNAAIPVAPSRSRAGWRVALAGVAAAAVAAVGLTTLARTRSPAASFTAVSTAPGERRAVVLGDGTRVALNGDTILRVAGDRGRQVEVRRGQAYFAVAHDAAAPFRVSAGGVVVQDVGTAFDVANVDGAVDVAVREGVVLYDPDDAAIRLTAGRSIRVKDGAATERPVETATVGGWRGGRLVYRDETLGRVASDVSRATGVRVTVDGDAARRRFSGVVMIAADRPLMFRRLAAVTGTTVERSAAGWRMSSSDR